MAIQIKSITPFSRPYKNYNGLGERIHGKFLYKYMPLKTAILCLQNNTIRFRKPSQWEDPFEKIYYLADYTNVMPTPPFSTDLYACCLTSRSNCEASWRIYTDDYVANPCVQFKIYIGQFRKFLEKFSKDIKVSVYEGRVEYGVSDYEIRHLYQKNNRLYPLFFERFDLEKYLNLMLLKRKYFEYEDEIRFFLTASNCTSDYIDVEIPWSHCIDSVTLPPITDKKIAESFKLEIENALAANSTLCKKEFPYLYTQVVKTKPNTLYEGIDPVTIE